MTPKEKAKELVYWYENLLEPSIKDKEFLKSKAKQCALICVDKKIDFLQKLESKVYDNDTAVIIAEELTEQTEVKQEIEKL